MDLENTNSAIFIHHTKVSLSAGGRQTGYLSRKNVFPPEYQHTITSRLHATTIYCAIAGTYGYIKLKVKWFHYRPGVAQRLGRGIALLFHDHGTWRGWVVSSRPRPHFTLGKDPVPILQEAGWAPQPVWTGGKSRPHRDSILFRLNYPAHGYIKDATHLKSEVPLYSSVIVTLRGKLCRVKVITTNHLTLFIQLSDTIGRAVCGRWLAKSVGSNPASCMVVCLLCVLQVVR